MPGAREERSTQHQTAGTLAAAECIAVLEALASLGIDKDRVLAEAGLSGMLPDEPLARVPAAHEHALWAAAEQVSGDPAIGLRIGVERSRHGSRNLVEYIALHAPTLRQAFSSVQPVLALVDDRGHLDVVEDGERIAIGVRRDGPARARGYLDSLVAGAFTFGTDHVPGFRLLDVSLTRTRPAVAQPYTNLLGRPPKFAAPRNELVIPRAVFDAQLRGADPAVGGLLRDHALQLLEQLPTADPFIDSARRALFRELSAGKASPTALARSTGTSARTLRRKLAALGTSYHDLLDELRRDLSCHLLRHSPDSIDAIAERLGFSTRSGFQRAFRRYTGQSPSEYREANARGTR